MHLGEALDQRKPDGQSAARACTGLVALDERLEQARMQVRRDSRPVVGDAQEDFVSLRSDDDADGAAARRELERIVEQVGYDLLDPRPVGIDPRRARLERNAMTLEA